MNPGVLRVLKVLKVPTMLRVLRVPTVLRVLCALCLLCVLSASAQDIGPQRGTLVVVGGGRATQPLFQYLAAARECGESLVGLT
jgi:hypothetical protein